MKFLFQIGTNFFAGFIISLIYQSLDQSDFPPSVVIYCGRSVKDTTGRGEVLHNSNGKRFGFEVLVFKNLSRGYLI